MGPEHEEIITSEEANKLLSEAGFDQENYDFLMKQSGYGWHYLKTLAFISRAEKALSFEEAYDLAFPEEFY